MAFLIKIKTPEKFKGNDRFINKNECLPFLIDDKWYWDESLFKDNTKYIILINNVIRFKSHALLNINNNIDLISFLSRSIIFDDCEYEIEYVY